MKDFIKRALSPIIKKKEEKLGLAGIRDIDDLDEGTDEPKEKIETKPHKVTELVDTTYLVKELPFFKWEWLPYLAVTIAGLFIFLGDILLILLSEGEILLVHVLLMLVPGVLAGGLMWIMYLVKLLFYMPTGKKVLAAEVLKGGSIYIRPFVPPEDGLVTLKSNKNAAPIPITKLKKHVEICSQKPFVILPEGWSQNVNIHDLTQNIELPFDSAELDTVMRKIKTTAEIMVEERLLNIKQKLKDPAFLISAISVFMSVMLIIGMLMMMGKMGGIEDGITRLVEIMETMPGSG